MSSSGDKISLATVSRAPMVYQLAGMLCQAGGSLSQSGCSGGSGVIIGGTLGGGVSSVEG
jgi:hypothetical protein